MRVHAALYVRVHAPGDGEPLRHLDVGQRRKEHGAEADQIHERRHALGIPVHVSEDTVRGDDDHEQQAVHGQIPQAQGTVQFLPVPKLFYGPFSSAIVTSTNIDSTLAARSKHAEASARGLPPRTGFPPEAQGHAPLPLYKTARPFG